MQISRGISYTKAAAPQVHEKLRALIVSGGLQPGARLSETEIASQYDVSRQPVREAFIKLSEEQLVSVRPQRGTFVTRISVTAVLTARFIREAVEADIVRRVAEMASDAQLARLAACLSGQRAAVSAGNAASFITLDDTFHRLLAEMAGQSTAWEYLDGLKTQMTRVRHISAREFAPEKLVDQHEDVLTELRRRDANAAETKMRKHLRQITLDLPGIVQAHPDFFNTQETET